MSTWEKIWNPFVDFFIDVKDFFVNIYQSIVNFLQRYIGHDAMIILGIMLAAIIISIILTKIIRK